MKTRRFQRPSATPSLSILKNMTLVLIMSRSIFDGFLAFSKKIRSARYHPGEGACLLFDPLVQLVTVDVMKDSSKMPEGMA
jgi:hypothetical protein